MDRRERDRYDDDNRNYGRYDGYSRDDSHYHGARNLTDQFERDFQQERGGWDADRGMRNVRHTYHEGDMGGAYERYSRERDTYNNDTSYRMSGRDRDNRYSDNLDRDRFRNYSSYGSSDSNRYGNERGYGRGSDSRSSNDMRQGYGISNYGGTSDRFNTTGNYDNDRYASGSGMRNRGEEYGSGMGDAFPNSSRGIPNYDSGNYGQGSGTGMGSTYGSKNYGGGTGYMSGNRGGAFGNETYGSSSGNNGGYGSMGTGSYGSGRGSYRGDTSHNSNRGSDELGGMR